MWSEAAVAHAIAEYNSDRMKIATAAKEFSVRRNTLRRKAAEYNGDDSGCPMTYQGASAL
jgi:transposase-like protein